MDELLPCGYRPDLFFSDNAHQIDTAKRLCGPCPERLTCLAGALDRQEPHGVWGGQLLRDGQVVPYRRPTGRPTRIAAAAWRAALEAIRT